jgi:large subunit ribosomal protein L25
MPASADLSARPRTLLGKKVSRLRRQGRVPCNIYGRNVASTAIDVEAAELRHIVRTVGHTGLVRISLDAGAPRTALIRQIQREAVTGQFLHIDFQEVSLTERMSVRVPVALVGRAPVADFGGLINQALDHVEVECLPSDIPSHFELDVSNIATTDAVLHVSDLVVPADVTVTTDPALVLVSVTVPSAERAEGEEAPAAGGEAAAEAAGEE